MAARLTDAHARNAKPKAKPYKLTDGSGLFLQIWPNGQKHWRYRFRILGNESTFAIGPYPQLTLKQARESRDWARALVKVGKNPAHQRRAANFVGVQAAANTFEAIADEWIQHNKNRWTPYYLKQVTTILGNDAYPYFGKLPIRDVSSALVLKAIQKVMHRDANTVAILLRQFCSAVFRFAVSTLRADYDPCAALKGAIIRQPVQHKTALSGEQIAEFCRRLDEGKGTPLVRVSLKLLLLTFVRPGELRQAYWSEFDLEKSEWRVPAERMKMREPHIVPLSHQTVRLLEELKALDLRRAQLFPNVRDPKRPMSNTTMNRYLERLGYKGMFSAHGFRATASTLLNEMGYRPDVIEKQLAHRERNQIRASYNHATYLPERRQMMQQWADFLDAQTQRSGVIVPLRSRKLTTS